MQSQGSVLTNKYAEGYPGRRYYGGCEYVDIVEDLAIARVKELFGAGARERTAHSGAQANNAVMHALLNPGDTIMGLSLAHGGHLTHGMKLNVSGKLYNVVAYSVDENGYVDMEQVRELALAERPKLIIAGWSAYPRQLDFAAFRAIADEIGVPVGGHGTLRGPGGCGSAPEPRPARTRGVLHRTQDPGRPRSGFILCTEELKKKIDSAVFPGQQGGLLMHVIAAKATAFKIAASEGFGRSQKRTIEGAQIHEAPAGAGREGRRRFRLPPAAPTFTWCSSTCATTRSTARRRGPAARRRHHRQPNAIAERPAPADGDLRSAHRHLRAGNPRLRRRGLHRGC